MEGLGEGKPYFPDLCLQNLREALEKNAATNFVATVCCGVLLSEFTYLWVNLHIGSNWGVKSSMMKIEWKPL